MTVRQTLVLLLNIQPQALVQHSGKGVQLSVAARAGWTLRKKAEKMEITTYEM